jgi:peroxiredoxin
MRLLLHLGDGSSETTCDLQGADIVLTRSAVLAATGWEVKDHGLCRGDVCRPASLGETVGLTELATALGRPLAVEVDAEEAVAVLGEPGGTTVRRGDRVPDLALTDADGRAVQVTTPGRRTLLVAWSTWCGCRYELPAWKQLTEELEPLGLDLVTVALDDDEDRVRHWTSKAGLPPVLDPGHRLSDVFGVVNVPSTVWLDEQGRVAKPPTIAPGDDQFKEFTEVDAARHHEALRRWMRDGVVPDQVPDSGGDDADLRLARTERRLAAWLHREGRTEAAERHFKAAVALAPLDFSIRRSSMRRRGQDPFGEDFFELWEQWSQAGRPGYTPT